MHRAGLGGGTLVTTANWEDETGGSQVQGHPGQLGETLPYHNKYKQGCAYSSVVECFSITHAKP